MSRYDRLRLILFPSLTTLQRLSCRLNLEILSAIYSYNIAITCMLSKQAQDRKDVS